jgi:murein DD-endopeptidase MepM/ murein hydrolase activator NlpD
MLRVARICNACVAQNSDAWNGGRGIPRPYTLYIRRAACLLFMLMPLTACQPSSGGVAVTLPATQAVVQLATYAPTNTRTPTAIFTSTPTPTVTLIPSNTPLPTDTAVPSITPTLERVERFFMQRPIASGGIDYADRTYPYGSTQQGNRPVHYGQDFANPRGTPILAVADGTIYYAGDDTSTLFGPQPNYYGQVVIIQHTTPSPDGQTVYSLYGHLDRAEVQTGAFVSGGDRIGLVGDRGVALGSHLHLEVRLGAPENYLATVNPDLWVTPYPSFGTLAGRVTDLTGNVIYGAPILIRSHETGSERYAYTYADDTLNSHPAWNENFTYGDLPEGDYTVIVSERGRVRFQQDVTIQRGRVTWIETQVELQPTATYPAVVP